MKDFTKWVDAWNTYNSAYDKAAEAGGGYSWTFFFMFLTFAASSVALFYETKRKKPIVTTIATAFALVGAMGVIQTVDIRSPKEIEAAVKVEKPRTLKDEIKHVWGLGTSHATTPEVTSISPRRRPDCQTATVHVSHTARTGLSKSSPMRIPASLDCTANPTANPCSR